MQSRYVAEFRKQMGVLLLIFGVVSLSAVLLVFCIFYMIVETQAAGRGDNEKLRGGQRHRWR